MPSWPPAIWCILGSRLRPGGGMMDSQAGAWGKIWEGDEENAGKGGP